MRRQSKNKMSNKRQKLHILLRPDFLLFNCSSIVFVICEWFFENKKIDKVPLASLQNSQKLGNSPFTQLSFAGDITTVQLKLINYSRKEVRDPFTEMQVS